VRKKVGFSTYTDEEIVRWLLKNTLPRS